MAFVAEKLYCFSVGGREGIEDGRREGGGEREGGEKEGRREGGKDKWTVEFHFWKAGSNIDYYA